MGFRISVRFSPIFLTAVLLSVVFLSAWATMKQAPSSRRSKALSGSLLYNVDHPPQCKERKLLCCNGIENPRRPMVKNLLAVVNVTIPDRVPTGDASSTDLVAVRCASTNMFGMGVDGDCRGHVVCCDDLVKNGHIAIGCDIVDVGI